MAYLCKDCDAYVGCHNNTRKPLGTMANKETREWRKKAHSILDPLWKFKKGINKKETRSYLYNQLRKSFGFDVHIGESDIKQCIKIIEWCKDHAKTRSE